MNKIVYHTTNLPCHWIHVIFDQPGSGISGEKAIQQPFL